MRLTNVIAFLARERLIREEKRVDCQAKILEFCDDEATEYAILSHRWIEEQEVDCEEIVELAKMDAIRQRGGYQETFRSCEQAEKDGWKCPDPCQRGSRITTPLCSIAKPFLWNLNGGAGSVSEEYRGDELDEGPSEGS